MTNTTTTTAPAEITTGTWTIIFAADPATSTEGRVTGLTAAAPRDCGDGWYAAEIDLMEGRTTLADAKKIIDTAHGHRYAWTRPHVAVNTITRERVAL